MNHQPEIEVATLGGGCFWCLEPVFLELHGVEKVEPGYSGGQVVNPSYQQVCTGETGHAEVVQVTFDSSRLAFRKLLEAFFAVHDPTTLNRQGADVGTQYRSVVFHHSEKQRKTAEELIEEQGRQDVWNAPIVTEVTPFSAFYPAESYHHNYFARNPHQPYCQVVIAPKLAKFRHEFRNRLRSDPAKGPS